MRTQNPSLLGEGFSFQIDAKSVNRLFTEETKQAIVGNITREDQFLVQISHNIWSENEQGFALTQLQKSLSSLKDDNSIMHWVTKFLKKGGVRRNYKAVKDYISSSNEFQTTSSLLQQFLDEKRQQGFSEVVSDVEEDSDVEVDSDLEVDSDAEVVSNAEVDSDKNSYKNTTKK